MSNCRPGQLARAVAGEFFGEVCEVLESAGAWHYKPTGQWLDCWLCRFRFPMPWENPRSDMPPTDGIYPDAWLRPISGGGADEAVPTAREFTAPKPEVESVR